MQVRARTILSTLRGDCEESGLLFFSQLRNTNSHTLEAKVEEGVQLPNVKESRPLLSSWPGSLAAYSFT